MTTVRRVEAWPSHDGVRLHLAHTEPAGTPRAHLPVVHGFAEHGGRYAAFADALAEQGIAVHALDLRGHGRSPGVRALVHDADRLVRDVVLLLERLQAETGPLALFGHSFGGAIAARVAQERPDLLDALVLSSPYLISARPEPKWLLRLADAGSHLLPWLRTRRIDPEAVSSLPEAVRRYREDPLVDHGGVRLASARELHALGRRVLEDAERLVTPTLIVHGERDPLADPAGSRLLATHAGSAHVTLRLVDDGFHELLNDAAAERVRAGIVEWLADLLGLREPPVG